MCRPRFAATAPTPEGTDVRIKRNLEELSLSSGIPGGGGGDPTDGGDDPDPACIVPKLAGKSLTQARAALTAAVCKLGTAGHVPRRGKRLPPLVVKASTPDVGASPARGRVNLPLGPKSRKRVAGWRVGFGGAALCHVGICRSLGQEMGQEPPQTPADPHVARSRENRLKSCPT
jgi:hypothetical protein